MPERDSLPGSKSWLTDSIQVFIDSLHSFVERSIRQCGVWDDLNTEQAFGVRAYVQGWCLGEHAKPCPLPHVTSLILINHLSIATQILGSESLPRNISLLYQTQRTKYSQLRRYTARWDLRSRGSRSIKKIREVSNSGRKIKPTIMQCIWKERGSLWKMSRNIKRYSKNLKATSKCTESSKPLSYLSSLEPHLVRLCSRLR